MSKVLALILLFLLVLLSGCTVSKQWEQTEYPDCTTEVSGSHIEYGTSGEYAAEANTYISRTLIQKHWTVNITRTSYSSWDGSHYLIRADCYATRNLVR